MKFYILLAHRDIPMISFHGISCTCTCIYSYITNNTLIVFAVKKVVLFSELACNRMCAGAAGRNKAAWFHVVYVQTETKLL